VQPARASSFLVGLAPGHQVAARCGYSKWGSSTYGARVNVHAWGSNVFTLGCCTHQVNGQDATQWYRSDFNATSAASALVAAACVSLQSYAVDRLCRRLTNVEMRDLLVSSGYPQGAGGHVGPCANLQEAMAQLRQLYSDCRFLRGDANADFGVNGADISYIGNWLYTGGPLPPCKEAADTNGDGGYDTADMSYLSNFLFLGGPQPPAPGPYGCGPDHPASANNWGCASYPSC
jgi:hypothetical protein